MRTDQQTAHTHAVGSTRTASAGGHRHGLSEVEAALAVLRGEYDAAIVHLDARIAALEASEPPPPPPPDGATVRVTSVPALLAALADDANAEIVVANGTYKIPGASSSAGQSGQGLWIDERFAGRTRPVLVRAETKHGVTFDGGGATYWIGLHFIGGAHDQTWQGFRFANAEPTGVGFIDFGGFVGHDPVRNITVRDCILTGFQGAVGNQGHAVYISHAFGGRHKGITLDGLLIEDTIGNVGGGIHIYHDTYSDKVPDYWNAEDVTIRNCTIRGVLVGFYVWAKTARNVLVEDCRVENARDYGVRYELGENVTFRRVTTTGSGAEGIAPTYYMPGGPYRYPSIPELGPDGVPGPKLVTFEACDFR